MGATGTLIALTAASAAMSAAGAISQGKAAKNMADTEAELARRQADRERQIGAMQAKQQRESNKRTEATQRGLLSTTGGDASTGSSLLVQEELAEEGEFNARLVENNAAAQASQFEADRVMALAAGKNARSASFFRAGNALLSGATDIATIKRG
jgi:hypothetical protein